jgi:RNA polymerase sigma-70 factor (ECF subfamily)
MEPQQELQLVQSCQAGNLDDFDPLYRHYVKPIYAFVYRRTLVREIAEDIVSQAFMQALEKIRSYKSNKGPFAAWLYGIARNLVTDYYRTKRDHQDIETVWDLSSDEDVALNADERMQYQEVREALQKIDPEKRDIVMMRLWDGLSYKEIAALTGKSEGNCKVILHRTLTELRHALPLAAFLLILLPPFNP